MVTAPDLKNHAARLRARLVVVLIAWLLLVFAVAVDLARGGRPDPPELRAAATTLNGAWRFQTGDDPRWAQPAAADSDWDVTSLTASAGSHDGDVGLPDYVAGWMANGHPDYRGYAWYRRAVKVPFDTTAWDILGPTLVDHGYELYWNGQLLGTSGTLGPTPRIVGTRPKRFALPDSAAGTRGMLAIRVYMLPTAARSPDGGGLHSAPILAPRAVGAALHRAQWERTIAGYIVDAVEPLAMIVLILMGLGIARAQWHRNDYAGFLMFACVALAFMAERRANNAIVAWTDWQQLTTYSWLANWLWIPAVAAWALAWNRWTSRPSRLIDAATLVLTIVSAVGAAMHSASIYRDARFAWLALFVVVAARLVRTSTLRELALATLAVIVLGLFGGELLDPLGVPGIWFPFHIGVSRTQYIYAAMIPLLAVIFVALANRPRDSA